MSPSSSCRSIGAGTSNLCSQAEVRRTRVGSLVTHMSSCRADVLSLRFADPIATVPPRTTAFACNIGWLTTMASRSCSSSSNFASVAPERTADALALTASDRHAPDSSDHGLRRPPLLRSYRVWSGQPPRAPSPCPQRTAAAHSQTQSDVLLQWSPGLTRHEYVFDRSPPDRLEASSSPSGITYASTDVRSREEAIRFWPRSGAPGARA